MPRELVTKRLATIGLCCVPLLGACQGTIWGNLGVLLLTVGIFCGTVLLGHSSPR